jgi:ribosomal protein L10
VKQIQGILNALLDTCYLLVVKNTLVGKAIEGTIEVVLRHFHQCCYRSNPLWFFC